MDDAQQLLLENLNEPQRVAVQHRDGPLLVLAGPGSGKTRVITHRAAYLVLSGVPARNMLAITFTNKAAQEMRERIIRLGAAGGMWIHTFHALGVRLLREFGPLTDVKPGFSIYDEADQRQVLKDAFEVAGVRESLLRPETAQAAISEAKNHLTTPAEYEAHATAADQIAIARVYAAYEQLLRARNAVDFDDLLMRVALLLRQNSHLADELSRRWQYLLIDEYQDTNRAQYVIARELARTHHNICATGDPDQSIYAWRGADIGNILAFERDYPNAVVVRLEQNYRSAGNILKAADRLIATNQRRKAKTLWTENAVGEPVQVWRFEDGRDESERIASTIQEQHRQGRPFSDFAIFYRINAISRGLEEALRHRGIAYRIARGVEFYNRREIKDALAYLRALVNPADAVAWLRCVNSPPRGIGKTTIEKLQAAAAETRRPIGEVLRSPECAGLNAGTCKKLLKFVALLDDCAKYAETHSLAETVDEVLVRSGLRAALKKEEEAGGEDRLANLDELVSAAKRYEVDQVEGQESSLTDFLQRISLASDQDRVDQFDGCVILMTLHTAKGLEFPVVFLAGLEHGLLPHERAIAKDGDIEEERRLCFVGMTRAKERLYISHANHRLLRGQLLPRCASVFLRELDEPDAVQWCDFSMGGRSGKRRPWDDQFVPAEEEHAFENSRRSFGERPNRFGQRREEEPVFSVEEAARAGGGHVAAPRSAGNAAFADWKSGTLVKHAMYGVGTIISIAPAAAQTRAVIRFAGTGEKTFVLELAPIERLSK